MPIENQPAPPSAPKDDRSHFLAHMGHDLRAPMTNILALTEALVDGVYGPLAPAQSETLKHIRENGYRMINMVTDLVDLARFETGQIKLEPVSCEIMEPSRAGVEMSRGLAKSKNVTVVTECVPPVITAVADARRLRQMMSGLATSAVVAAPADGQAHCRVEAQPSKGVLLIQFRMAKRGMQISPSDNSMAQPAPDTASLQRLRKLSSVAVGTVEKIVEVHGGTFQVADSGGGMYAIIVSVPLHFPDHSSPESRGGAVASGEGVSASSSAAPLILLADDEEIIRTITRDYLESTGYRVKCVTNGREALDFISVERPDVVIMDMQMPVLDGMEALIRLRASADASIAKVPVISLSGLATPWHREKCLAAGATACLAKPFGIKDLERLIQDSIVKPH